MNLKLMEEIIKHIYSNLGIFNSLQNGKSLTDNDFRLPTKIIFIDDNDDESYGNVWGANLSLGDLDVSLFLADCTQDSLTKEFALIVHLKGSQSFGCYLVNKADSIDIESEPLIAYNTNESWAVCNTAMQASLLVGLEGLRDIPVNWNKLINYKDQLELINSFIKYHNDFYGSDNEG